MVLLTPSRCLASRPAERQRQILAWTSERGEKIRALAVASPLRQCGVGVRHGVARAEEHRDEDEDRRGQVRRRLAKAL